MGFKKKIYYSGKNYLPYLEHPAFGKFPLNEDDMSFVVPKPYAEILLKASPTLFSYKRDNRQYYEDQFKGSGGFAKLTKYAKQRGLDVKTLKTKEDLINALVELDKKEQE